MKINFFVGLLLSVLITRVGSFVVLAAFALLGFGTWVLFKFMLAQRPWNFSLFSWTYWGTPETNTEGVLMSIILAGFVGWAIFWLLATCSPADKFYLDRVLEFLLNTGPISHLLDDLFGVVIVAHEPFPISWKWVLAVGRKILMTWSSSIVLGLLVAYVILILGHMVLRLLDIALKFSGIK